MFKLDKKIKIESLARILNEANQYFKMTDCSSTFDYYLSQQQKIEQMLFDNIKNSEDLFDLSLFLSKEGCSTLYCKFYSLLSHLETKYVKEINLNIWELRSTINIIKARIR